MVLTVVGPESEAMALEVAVKSRSRQSYDMWDEWEEFLLSLAFGPSVIEHLRARYPEFDSHAQVLALAILARNRVALTPEEHHQFVRGLLHWRNWRLDRNVHMSSEENLPVLVEIMQGEDVELAKRAAGELISRHYSQLSRDQLARAAILSATDSLWGLDGDERWLRLIESDPEFVKALMSQRLILQRTGAQDPLLAIYAEALNDDSKWADVVWRLLCVSQDHNDAEMAGYWLLSQAQKSQCIKAAIGNSAAKYLEDPRIAQHRWTDSIQWLAVIADECKGLDAEQLRAVLLRHPEPIYCAAAVAIIARLDAVPDNFKSKQRVGAMPNLQEIRAHREFFSEEELSNFARSAETLHPSLCQAIEAHAGRAPLSQGRLDELAVEGSTGSLVAVALAYIYGIKPELDWLVRHVSLSEKLPMEQNGCRRRLTQCWYACLRGANADPDFKAALIQRLSSALNDDDFNFFSIVGSVFRLRPGLTIEEVAKVVGYYAKHPGYFDYGLAIELSGWLTEQPFNAQERGEIARALDEAISLMDGWTWMPEHGVKTSYPLLLFPAVQWAMLPTQPSELSIRAFLKGIRHLFTVPSRGYQSENREHDLLNAMSDAAKLFQRIPKKSMGAVINAGAKSDDPIVRTVTRFFKVGAAVDV
jgi:hypothetical protein